MVNAQFYLAPVLNVCILYVKQNGNGDGDGDDIKNWNILVNALCFYRACHCHSECVCVYVFRPVSFVSFGGGGDGGSDDGTHATHRVT